MKEKPIFDVLAYTPDKIKVSASLIDSTIELLENIDPEELLPDQMHLYGYVLHIFKRKKAKFELRKAYAKFFCDPDIHEHFTAYMDCRLQCDDEEIPF